MPTFYFILAVVSIFTFVFSLVMIAKEWELPERGYQVDIIKDNK